MYAIYNRERDKIYIGHTENLEARLLRHNGVLKNKKSSFTSKNSGLWELVHQEKFLTRREAILRERVLKNPRGRKFIKEIIKKLEDR